MRETTSRRSILAMTAAAPALAATSAPAVGFATGTYGMRTMKTPDALRTLREIGYDGVEPCLIAGWPTDPALMTAADRSDLRKAIADTGLAVPAMLESLPVALTPQKREDNLKRVKLAVELANELVPGNPPMVETILGGKTADWEKLKGPMADELKSWARIAEDAKTTFCFKPHAAHAVHSPERTLWLLKQVGSPRMRIVYDYSHFFLEGFALSSSIRELFPHIGFFAVKDSAGTPEKHDYLLPGDGKTDYSEYFRLLKDLRYDGWVIVEVSAMIHRKPDYQPVPTARLCYERLAPLIDRAGLRRRGRNHG